MVASSRKSEFSLSNCSEFICILNAELNKILTKTKILKTGRFFNRESKEVNYYTEEQRAQIIDLMDQLAVIHLKMGKNALGESLSAQQRQAQEEKGFRFANTALIITNELQELLVDSYLKLYLAHHDQKDQSGKADLQVKFLQKIHTAIETACDKEHLGKKLDILNLHRKTEKLNTTTESAILGIVHAEGEFSRDFKVSVLSTVLKTLLQTIQQGLEQEEKTTLSTTEQSYVNGMKALKRMGDLSDLWKHQICINLQPAQLLLGRVYIAQETKELQMMYKNLNIKESPVRWSDVSGGKLLMDILKYPTYEAKEATYRKTWLNLLELKKNKQSVLEISTLLKLYHAETLDMRSLRFKFIFETLTDSQAFQEYIESNGTKLSSKEIRYWAEGSKAYIAARTTDISPDAKSDVAPNKNLRINYS